MLKVQVVAPWSDGEGGGSEGFAGEYGQYGKQEEGCVLHGFFVAGTPGKRIRFLVLLGHIVQLKKSWFSVVIILSFAI